MHNGELICAYLLTVNGVNRRVWSGTGKPTAPPLCELHMYIRDNNSQLETCTMPNQLNVHVHAMQSKSSSHRYHSYESSALQHFNYIMQTSAKPGDRCHLLELPAELRLCIYNLLFPCRTIYIWVDRNVYRWRSFTQTTSIPLLATCSTIHREAAPVFYDNTTVRFSICDEFERPLSRYHRFSGLDELNAASFHKVRKIQLSLHTLTEPVFTALHKHIRGLLARLDQCRQLRGQIEIHFEFWSTISDQELYDVYETLCEIDHDRTTEISTRKTGSRTVLYRHESLERCVRMIQGDIALKRLGIPLLMRHPEIGLTVGPRDLVISSAF